MEEESKAIEEGAKTIRKALEVSEKAGGFISKIFGEAFQEVGGMAVDQMRYYRCVILLGLSDKWDVIIKKRKLEGKTIPIPKRIAIPLLESASLESEDSIQDMWAGLIANAMDPEKRLDVKRVYIQMLSSVEPLDVAILTFLARQNWKLYREVPSGGITIKFLEENFNASKKDVQLSLQNLYRLGCIVDEAAGITGKDLAYFRSGARVMDERAIFMPSQLGFALVEACQQEEETEHA
jgi:hypothetical protein